MLMSAPAFSAALHAARSGQNLLQACADAQEAVQLNPAALQAWECLAQALLETGDFYGALTACRQGERQLGSKSNLQDPFTALLDQVAILAALQGSRQGFDGRQLEVGHLVLETSCATSQQRVQAWPAGC